MQFISMKHNYIPSSKWKYILVYVKKQRGSVRDPRIYKPIYDPIFELIAPIENENK